MGNSHGIGVFYSCFKNDLVTGTLSGEIKIQNSFGFAPAEYLGYLHFLLVMLVAQGLCFIVWTINFRKHAKHQNTILHHYYLTITIYFFFLATITEYFTWGQINQYGRAMWVLRMLTHLIHGMKMTMIIYTTLNIAAGLGCAIERIASWKRKLFAVAGLSYAFLHMVSFLVDVWLLDKLKEAVVGTWAFSVCVLFQMTLSSLHSQGQVSKIEFYQNFNKAMWILIAVSMIFAVTHIISLNFDGVWAMKWWFDKGSWELLLNVLLLICARYLRPTTTSKFYASAMQLAQEDELNDVFTLENKGLKMEDYFASRSNSDDVNGLALDPDENDKFEIGSDSEK